MAYDKDNNKDNTRDNNNRQNHGTHNRPDNPQPQHNPEVEKQVDEDDNIATAEEMEEFIRSRREKRSANHRHAYEEINEGPVPTDLAANESAMDPYLEPDPTLPKVEYNEPIYLSRGCNHCPESYVPVSETELRSCCKVGACNWMKDVRRPMDKPFDCVEVRFKNNRKEFFRLPDGIDVSDGDIVAVEGIPGHDVGIVSLTGEVCRIQMLKKKVNPESENIKKLFRRAKVSDIEHWTAAIKAEDNTLKKTRHIAEELGLVMKVNDVEYQGDHSKAIFYYTADDRVDFRNLIKVLAEQFHVRIEMKQIGVRQEAGKVGGLGTCGREIVLQYMAYQLQVGNHKRRQSPANPSQPTKTGRTMRKIEMLSELRILRICRCIEKISTVEYSYPIQERPGTLQENRCVPWHYVVRLRRRKRTVCHQGRRREENH